MPNEMRNVHTGTDLYTHSGFFTAIAECRPRDKEPRALYTSSYKLSAISSQRSAISTFNPHSAIRNPHSAIRNPHSIIRNPHSAIRNPHSIIRNPHSAIRNRKGFTLIELIVVVAILAILVALTIPAATSLLNDAKINKTLNTLQLLENAIDQFVFERPLDGSTACPCASASEPAKKNYKALFGPYPPSPTAAFDPELTADPLCARTTPYAENTITKFNMLLATYMRALPSEPRKWRHAKTLEKKIPDFTIGIDDNADKGDFAGIECMLLFLKTFSPQAKEIINRLPDSVLTNKDTSGGEYCRDVVQVDLDGNGSFEPNEPKNEPAYDLFEVVDAWDRPLRYDIKQIREVDSSGNARFIDFSWELRSAGPDGRFDPNGMFSPADNSDDVILKGK